MSRRICVDEMQKKSQYNLALWSIFGVLFLFLTSSCIMLTRYNISDDSFYKKYIGTVYKTKKKMVLLGIKDDISDNRIESYLIVSLPGIGGPEIKQLGYVSPGTILKINRIIRVSPSLFLGQDIVFVAELLGDFPFKGTEVDIYSASGTYTKVKVAGKKIFVLNPEYFEIITEY